MSCSGIQFLSSLIGDEKAMRFTNVIPSDTPQDAYAEVARIANILLKDKNWVDEQIKQREKNRTSSTNKSLNERPQRMMMYLTTS